MSNYQIFKYSPINKNLIDSLAKEYIYFAHPRSLNDPFDCKVDISESINRAANESNGQAQKNLVAFGDSSDFLKFTQESIKKIGICSFSISLLQPVLWSHYADEHKGVCCMYEIPPEFINFFDTNIIGLTDVKYGENLLTETLINIANDLSSMDNSTIFEKIVIPLFSSKGTAWGYEKEIRIVRSEVGPVNMKKEFLKQVCFGLHTPEKDRDLVRNIINKGEYSPDYCEITKSNTDFGLNVNDL